MSWRRLRNSSQLYWQHGSTCRSLVGRSLRQSRPSHIVSRGRRGALRAQLNQGGASACRCSIRVCPVRLVAAGSCGVRGACRVAGAALRSAHTGPLAWQMQYLRTTDGAPSSTGSMRNVGVDLRGKLRRRFPALRGVQLSGRTQPRSHSMLSCRRRARRVLPNGPSACKRVGISYYEKIIGLEKIIREHQQVSFLDLP